MAFTILVLGKFKLILHLIDIDLSDGNIQIGLEVAWK